MALLAVEDVTRRFGGIVALADVSLALEKGEIVGLIGPNGAGKTTLFNLITRLYRPNSGRILFDGKDLTRTPAYRIVRLGIARTFQNVVLFQNMTVLENLLVGAHSQLRPFSERRGRKQATEMLEYLQLSDLGERLPGGLPFGTLKRVELARALVAKPTLLLLDEPAGGLNHEEVGELAEAIRRLRRDFDLTILLVEHHMQLVMSVCDRVHVLNFGRKIAEGTPGEVQADPDVIEAYLGGPKLPTLLELRGVEARYGPIKALHGVSLTVAEGEIVALLGANGAGKTTTLRAVSGTVRHTGEIVFQGKQIAHRKPDAVARAGVAHVPEGRGLFAELSVWENLRMGAYVRGERRTLRKEAPRVFKYFPWLERRRDQQAGTLSGGEQQMLALARALVGRPRLLMLDEPSLGLAPTVVREIFRIVKELNADDGLTVLVVEQNANVALDAAARAYVLEVGQVAIEGQSAELRRHEGVRKSYLGY